ncbi:10440_t:CDS:2 [Entrophospora sp. SA101]|nr:6648_t:CDS:2 [Entrophospora sp. SA101]CAJ0748233.1 15763_t:CDS:2 [Entrophospora sp. SA101]CAJ0753126.1 10440_t:CDS:2 [Entrophospora sp. SA101]CAJ0842448.1 10090_t:CDS:2 [Entrophospora sp. SA101]CAJ0911257.1 20483_t:CDS:2 [Entrophospora sp. SA101]
MSTEERPRRIVRYGSVWKSIINWPINYGSYLLLKVEHKIKQNNSFIVGVILNVFTIFLKFLYHFDDPNYDPLISTRSYLRVWKIPKSVNVWIEDNDLEQPEWSKEFPGSVFYLLFCEIFESRKSNVSSPVWILRKWDPHIYFLDLFW